jgi:hypothetical protein
MRDLFNGFDAPGYEQEAEQRWGNTEACQESKRRSARYTKQDWRRFRTEQEALYRDLYAALTAGKSADDTEVMNLAERARLAIDRWFYPCSRAMHVQLADMYEADGRFADNIDKFGAGLTSFLAASIRANSRRSDE